MSEVDAIDELRRQRYLAIDVELEPLGATTIQPTTFANTGPSFYIEPDGRLSGVVDSVASMANQLELTVWDEAVGRPTEPIQALPWIEVRDGDVPITSSRRAAHRLNAASIMQGALAPQEETFHSVISRELADPRPPILHRLADVVWRYDPLALVHGCWFAGVWDGRARLTRALQARIDAVDVQSQSAQTGGQKTADFLGEVSGRQTVTEDRTTKTVAGEVPHFASEISAHRIVAPILLDVGLLGAYGLGEARERALVATATLQIRSLIDAWPRRRSRCVLAPTSFRVSRPDGWTLPSRSELDAVCRAVCEEAAGTDRAEPRLVHRRQSKRPAAG
jgi:CRISPR-associated protein Csb1